MARIDNIIQQIRNAQAEAIVKNGGITASGSKVDADVKAILQKQLAQQQSAKKDPSAPSGQIQTPAAPQGRDTRTSQQKHSDAQKAYDEYVASDEYKQKITDAYKAAQAGQKLYAPSMGIANPVGTYQKPTDDKEQELKAAADYYKQQVNAEESQRIMGADLTELESWTDEERGRLEDYLIYNDRTNPFMATIAELKIKPLVDKYGREKVYQMAESLGRNQNATDAAALQESAAASAGKNAATAAGHSLLTPGANLVGAITGPLGFVEEVTSPLRSGRYSTLDPNNPGYLPDVYSEAVRGQVTEDIKGDGSNWLRNLFALGYQGGMSALDSTARILLSGGNPGISAALASSGTFGSSIRQYSQQGASPEQAAAMAVVNAGLEYATEKLPTEQVLKLFKGGTTKDTIGKVLTQAFLVEPTSEEVNLFASVGAEAMILGEKSEMQQKIGELCANGMSYEDAQKQVYSELWKEAAETYVVSAFSGGLSSGGAAVIGSMANGGGAQKAPAAAPAVDAVQQALEATGREYAQKVPKQEAQPITPEQELLKRAIADTIGGQSAQQSDDISNNVPGNVAQIPQTVYNKRGSAVQDTIDRLNRGGADTPSLDEIMAISEIAAAEAANDGTETIYLPNREGIRETGYQTAMQKGSWNGKDYAGPIKQERRMDIVIGLPGSGKSSVYTERLSQENQSRVIDTDDFREYIPEYNGSNAGVVHKESSEIRNMVLKTALKNGDNILLSTIGADATSLENKINAYKKAGYAVFLHLNELPNEIAMARAIGRYLPDDGSTGRYVSPRLIASYGNKPTETYLYLTGKGVAQNGRLGEDLRGSRSYGNGDAERTASGIGAGENSAVSQGVSTNGGLEGNLRQGRGQMAEGAGEAGGGTQVQTKPETLLAGYDWYNNDVERGQPPRLIQSSAGIKGTGAAEAGFSGKPAYHAALSEDNAQADRRDDVRPMELPKQDINGGNVSAVTGNVYGSKITPDDFASLMEEPTAKGDFSYAAITNDQATKMAQETIGSAGTWENAYDSWKQSVTNGNAGAEMSARGAIFLNHAAQQGNKQQWLEALHYMQQLGTNTAQGLQAMRIIRTLVPTDKIEFLKMSVQKMAEGIKQKYGVDIVIDQKLLDACEKADTDEARDAVISDIQQNIADQIPSTFLDKWTALRYMNMLGNLKTNVRNIVGNAANGLMYRAKDAVGALLEKTVGAKERTKSLLVSKELLNACKADFKQVAWLVSSGGKYGDRTAAYGEFEQGVQDKRRIFKNPVMEGYRKGTNWMMNNEKFGDEAFGRAAYSRALAGYLQANGVKGNDLSKVDSKLLDKARAYAVREAQEATFHDNSALARRVSKARNSLGVAGQGILPFAKTPANVLTRAEEFSPLGLINSTVMSVQKAMGKGNVTGADVVNSWAKTITGSFLFALGGYLWDLGYLIGGPDEDEEKAEFDELNGSQNYAIRLPDGTSYTIDWLTPAAMPMFMGAQCWKLVTDGRDITLADMEQVFTSIADPMIQMSMLQGLNDSLDGIKYADDNLGQFVINAMVSYLTQGLTNTALGQIERAFEENRQTTYIDKNSGVPEWMQRTLGKASQKLPGWDYQQMDYRNAWGQTEKNEGGSFAGRLLYNMLSPGYVSKEQSSRVTKELYRLRESTGENVFPQSAPKTVSYTDWNGTKHVNRALTQKELETFQKVQGQTAMKLLAEITGNSSYKALTDAQQAEVIRNVYTYAQEKGKTEAIAGYHSEADSWLQNMGDDAGTKIVQKVTHDTLSRAIDKTFSDMKNGFTGQEKVNTASVEKLYDVFESTDKATRDYVLDKAAGNTAHYLASRRDGVSHSEYMKAADDIAAVKGTGANGAVRDADRFRAITESNITDSAAGALIKAYMEDGSDAEKRYDYITEEMKMSPGDFADAAWVYTDEKAKGSGYPDRIREKYQERFKVDKDTADLLYKLYGGYEKPWEE